jgi:hypothetical protein
VLSITVLAFIVVTSARHASAISILDTQAWNGHTYLLLSEGSWTEAEAFAVGLGGHLVTINDAAEDVWVSSQFGYFAGLRRDLWIGLNDAGTEGVFEWSSGESITYLNWYPGEPNNFGWTADGEDYVQILPPAFVGCCGPGASRWNDMRNLGFGSESETGWSNRNHGVVELSAIPEPSALLLFGSGTAILMHYRQRGRSGS